VTGPGREEHFEATGLASMAIEELQNHLREVIGHFSSVRNAIDRAVGNSQQESAANAVNYTAAARQQCEEAVGQLEAAKQEMNRYSGGF
jgi:hypothetical protein